MICGINHIDGCWIVREPKALVYLNFSFSFLKNPLERFFFLGSSLKVSFRVGFCEVDAPAPDSPLKVSFGVGFCEVDAPAPVSPLKVSFKIGSCDVDGPAPATPFPSETSVVLAVATPVVTVGSEGPGTGLV